MYLEPVLRSLGLNGGDDDDHRANEDHPQAPALKQVLEGAYLLGAVVAVGPREASGEPLLERGYAGTSKNCNQTADRDSGHCHITDTTLGIGSLILEGVRVPAPYPTL